MGKTSSKIWGIEVSPARDRDTGMAVALLFVLVALWRGETAWARWAALALVVTMVWPRLLRPLSVAWFGLARCLGFVVSNILLSVVFFVVLTPVGLVRRLLGRDPLMRRRFGRNDGSVFHERDDTCGGGDIERPY